MPHPTPLTLSPALEAARVRLERDPTDPVACRDLREHLSQAGPAPVAHAFTAAADLLDGYAPQHGAPVRERRLPRLGKGLQESLVLHPRERAQRHHQLASVLGRLLHVLQGDETARAIARVTEKASPEHHPRLHRLSAACSRALEIAPPEIRIARGEELLFLPLVDRSPFLCIHAAWAAAPPEPENAERAHTGFSTAELLFALGHSLQHVHSHHTALLQLGSECLEALLLDQVPFLVRTPLKFASKAVGATRMNVAVKKVGERLPDRSRSRRVVNALGDLLPDHHQETFLPETVHEWVRAWVLGVEYSADRAGLLLCGSLRTAVSAMLRQSPALAPAVPELKTAGLRAVLLNHGETDRPCADRLRELLRFSLSHSYLEFVLASTPTERELPV